jgi:hypothetical protein
MPAEIVSVFITRFSRPHLPRFGFALDAKSTFNPSDNIQGTAQPLRQFRCRFGFSSGVTVSVLATLGCIALSDKPVIAQDRRA